MKLGTQGACRVKERPQPLSIGGFLERSPVLAGIRSTRVSARERQDRLKEEVGPTLMYDRVARAAAGRAKERELALAAPDKNVNTPAITLKTV